VVKSVDTRDLKSLDHKSCRFESGPGHHFKATFLVYRQILWQILLKSKIFNIADNAPDCYN
jgi:hypothetical protein